MSRKRMITKKKKVVLLVGTAALVGSAALAMTGTGNAGQRQGNQLSRCNGLARLGADHQRFIANERANPNVNSRERIANSIAAIRQIRQQQQSAGCNGSGRRQASQVVCAGSTVTLSGEGGAPAASSNQFPAGTQLRVTNLDNNRSTTVEVNSPSGSCVLLNNAAFEQVREPGRNVIRNVRVERVG
ncbi:hypothetical protein ACFYW6_33660 [Streptomyces sp. NPDC002659]|uniref:hypothetical protein n=1 Tax=Streptomyces sp. NPDC002659 TaxID=3364656 RepID=UPI003673F57D